MNYNKDTRSSSQSIPKNANIMTADQLNRYSLNESEPICFISEEFSSPKSIILKEESSMNSKDSDKGQI